MKRWREGGGYTNFSSKGERTGGRRTPRTSGGGGGSPCYPPCVRISPRRRSSHADRGGRRCGGERERGNIRSSCGVPHANGPYKFGKVLHIQLLLGKSKGSSLKGGRGRGAFGVDETNAPLWLSGIGDKTHSRFSAQEEGLLEKARGGTSLFAVHHQLERK